MPKISIILPVYNSEKYISQCIESVLLQTLSDFELIIIDDGSIDSSGKICDRYAQSDNRISVIHQNNNGVSYSRKIGIEKASSEWIGFIDSDDWIEPDTLKNTYDTAIKEKSDIVCFGMQKISQTETTIIKFSNTDIYSNFLHYPIFMNSFCNKLIKKALFTENSIDFGTGIITSEDLLVVFQLFHFAQNISYVSQIFYNYRDNSESVTQTPLTQEKVLADCIVARKQYLICKKNKTLKKAKSYIFHRNLFASLPFIRDKNLFNPILFKKNTIPLNNFYFFPFNIFCFILALCVCLFFRKKYM